MRGIKNSSESSINSDQNRAKVIIICPSCIGCITAEKIVRNVWRFSGPFLSRDLILNSPREILEFPLGWGKTRKILNPTFRVNPTYFSRVRFRVRVSKIPFKKLFFDQETFLIYQVKTVITRLPNGQWVAIKWRCRQQTRKKINKNCQIPL